MLTALMVPSYAYVLVGIALVVAGRKLYWLTVGVLGFLIGMFLAVKYVPAHPHWMIYVVAAGLGFLGAIAAVVLQKVAIGILGFFSGGFFVANIVQEFHWMREDAFWLPFLLGGVLGALLLFFLFDWALIVSSSAAGSYLIVREMQINQSWQLILFIVFSISGVLIQFKTRKKKSGGKSRRRPEKEKKVEAEGSGSE